MTCTFFNQAEPKFLPLPEDKAVVVQPFLDAANHQILPFLDILGTAFRPIKADIDGNITKLQRKYDTNPKKFCTFNDLLRDELDRKATKQKDSATLSLLWLKRALQFIIALFRHIISDTHAGTRSENMVGLCRKAYEESLKRYHSWLVQKIFGLVSHAIPYRRNFLKMLALGQEGMEEKVIAEMEHYVEQLAANVDQIQHMYDEFGLDFPDKA